MLNGTRLKARREELKMSQTTLGDKLGVSKSSICCYERETRNPSLDGILELVEALGVSADYLLGTDHVVTVLSGMSNLEQLNDNVKTVKNLKEITKEENELLEKLVETINESPTIPCTDCKYCVKDCPMEINIPQVFKVMNHHLKFGADKNKPSNMWAFQNTIGKSLPSSCIACAMCESQCPQKINIIERLEEIKDIYEC